MASEISKPDSRGLLEENVDFYYTELPDWDKDVMNPQVVLCIQFPPLTDFPPFNDQFSMPIYISHTTDTGVMYSLVNSVLGANKKHQLSTTFKEAVCEIPNPGREKDDMAPYFDELDDNEAHILSAVISWIEGNLITMEMSMLIGYCQKSLVDSGH